MELDETKLQEVVEKIAYQQFGQEQIDDLYAKMGMLNEYVQEQLRLFAVVGRSEQLKCQCKKAEFTRTVDAEFNPLCGRCGKAL
jgi:hypothetical protein